MQDHQWYRGEGKLKSRDGCRVPLPWKSSGSSFGFGSAGAHLPQPKWFAETNVETQEHGDSTLNLYRKAIQLRKATFGSETVDWLQSPPQTTAFVRDGITCITNFSEEQVGLPDGEVLIASSPISEGKLPGNSTAWVAPL